jgi:chromosomal replication initiator protein
MLEHLEEKWPEILDFFKYEYDIADVSFNSWILPLEVKSFENGLVTLVYNSEIGKPGLNFINKKYFSLLKITIEEIIEQEIELQIVLPNNESNNEDNNEDSKLTSVVSEDISLENRIIESNLNKKYTFDSFVVGSNNNIAQVTALAVAESPGEIYNPLFIYGGVGLGKTHLIQSIGNFALKNNPDIKVLYTTSESFTNEVIDLLARNETKQEEIIQFRNKYRSVDILLIDDIQFIIGKERTQEELFNIFNDLFMKHKHIVITSDRKPKDMEGLTDRLINRFEQGLTVDIQNPDYETRMAILKKKAELAGYGDIEEVVLQYIANHFVSNVRELEGSLTRVITFSKISHSPITIDFAADVLKDIVSPNQANKITCDYIINIVADHLGVSSADICSKKKIKEVAYARQVCMYLCRVFTDEKLETIASILKKKNHATVSYGYDKIKAEIEVDPDKKEMIDTLKKKIDPN